MIFSGLWDIFYVLIFGFYLEAPSFSTGSPVLDSFPQSERCADIKWITSE